MEGPLSEAFEKSHESPVGNHGLTAFREALCTIFTTKLVSTLCFIKLMRFFTLWWVVLVFDFIVIIGFKGVLDFN